jgi:phosphate transport system permease protein
LTTSANSLTAAQPGLRARLDLPRRITQAAALVVIAAVVLLLGFILWRGMQLFVASGVPVTQIFSSAWHPDPLADNTNYGLLPFIGGTLAVMAVAALIATPLSVGLALFLAEVAPTWARRIVQPAMEVFVGIPSVVYGWLGLVVLVPFLRTQFGWMGFATGFSWFAGSAVLSLMILPTITSISYDAFVAVPPDMRSASLALGTTRWQAIRHVVLPAAATGVLTAIVFGLMRAAGEALAVQMVIGNSPVVPTSLMKPVTTLTSQITLDMSDATGTWNEALWTMGLVLLIISLTFVLIIRRLGSQRTTA